MTRDKIIELMLKADAIEGVEEDGSIFVEFSERQLMTFVALVIAAEREACAKVCEEQLNYFTPIPCPDKISGCLVDHHGPVQRKKTATECAAAIRARGEA